MKILKLFLLIVIFSEMSRTAFGQDEDSLYNAMLTERIVNETPVYKPVVGIGVGVMGFWGEVHDNVRSLNGSMAFKLNIATFLDKKHLFKTNFVILKGKVTGNERQATADTTRNYNFQSDILSFGINFHYDFGHFISFSGKNFIRPYISIGFENLQFNSKTDLYYKGTDNLERKYFYWSDGTMRNRAENRFREGAIINRDYDYETDLRDLNRNGLGTYSQNTFAIPIDLGVDLKISERLNLRIGSSLHYTFTDNIDDVSYKATGNYRKGDRWNDMFTYNYCTIHFDLFSDAKEILLHKLVADVSDFDYAMFADEDNDGVRDLMDQCPGTPFGIGVVVDSLGCAMDGDKDGVADYLDKEPNTLKGAMVDDNGVAINADEYATKINIDGINRKEVEAFLLMRKAQSRGRSRTAVPIPPKFKTVDTDGDRYISFDELVKSINDFFDASSDLNSKDVYELQDFFFEQ